MADDKFKLPRSSYEELTKIIRAYGAFNDPASLDEVSGAIGIGRVQISGNSAFLTQVEILESGQKKITTPKGRQLAKSLDFEMPDQIRTAWRKVVDENVFLTRILGAIRIRKGMDDSTLQAHIAYSAGEAKKAFVMTGARCVVDILRAAELIKDSEGKYVVTERTDDPDLDSGDTNIEDLKTALATLSRPTTHMATVPLPPRLSADKSSGISISLNIDVHIDCKPTELEDLGDRLRQIIDQLGPSPTDAAE